MDGKNKNASIGLQNELKVPGGDTKVEGAHQDNAQKDKKTEGIKKPDQPRKDDNVNKKILHESLDGTKSAKRDQRRHQKPCETQGKSGAGKRSPQQEERHRIKRETNLEVHGLKRQRNEACESQTTSNQTTPNVAASENMWRLKQPWCEQVQTKRRNETNQEKSCKRKE